MTNDQQNSLPSTEDRFKETLIQLLKYIQKICRHMYDINRTKLNPVVVSLFINFTNNYDKNILIDDYIKNSNPYWDKILNRDEDFFKENSNDIFGAIKYKQVDKYIELFTTLLEERDEEGNFLINKEHRDAFWPFHEVLVKISIKHIHHKREPYVIIEDGVKMPSYRKEYCPSLDTNEYLAHAKKWGVILKFQSDKK